MASGSNINLLISEVPKLTGKNYPDWKFAVSMVLRRAGTWHVISGETAKPIEGDTSEWKSKAEEGFTIIGLTVQPDQYQYIKDLPDGVEAWKAFADIYENNTPFNRVALQRQFYELQHDPQRPIQEYISGMTSLGNRLKAMGVLREVDIAGNLILNLDKSWDNIASVLWASMDERSVVADVVGPLLNQERRRENRRETVEGVMSSVGNQRQVRIKCFRCGNTGHIARQCKEIQPKKTSNKGKTAHATDYHEF